MIEEAYEAVDAIDSGRPERIKDELGDVLLQVALHSAMAERDGDFTFTDVTDNISRKLISRHTHVFGKDEADSPEAVISVWDKNKMAEKGHTSFLQTLTDIPAGLPALMRADKLQRRAAKAGFDWPDAQGALAKVEEQKQVLQIMGAEIEEIAGANDCFDPSDNNDPQYLIERTARSRAGEIFFTSQWTGSKYIFTRR